MKKTQLLLLCLLLMYLGQAQQPDSTKIDSFFKTKELRAVTIAGKKPLLQQTTGGIVVNVETSILSRGSNALELLERSPGVQIDRRNNSINLNGRGGVLLLIDGRPLRMSAEQAMIWLASMSANDIIKLELLDAPPAKYDADGIAGVINVITRQSKNQFTGGLLAMTTGMGQGEKLTGSVNISKQIRNWRIYGSYVYNRDRTASDLTVYSAQDMPAFGGPLTVAGESHTGLVRNVNDATIAVDGQLNKNLALHYSGSVNQNKSASRDNSHMQLNFPDSILRFQSVGRNTNRWRNALQSLDAEFSLTPLSKLKLGADYLHFSNQVPGYVTGNYSDADGKPINGGPGLFANQQRSYSTTVINIAVAKIDYSRDFTDNIHFETGAKLTKTSTISRSGITQLIDSAWANIANAGTNGKMQELIGAAYGSIAIKAGLKTQLGIDLRVEQTTTEIKDGNTGHTSFSKKSLAVFPGLRLTEKLQNNAELQFAFSSRISRPAFTDLASFIQYSDPTAVYSGNTSLKPTMSHLLKAGYAKDGKYTSLLVGIDKNPIARYQITENEDRSLLLISPQNLAWQRSISLQHGGNIKLTNWWNMSYQGTVAWRRFRVTHVAEPFEKSYLNLSANISNSFRIGKNYAAEFSGWYNSRSYNGTTKLAGMGAMNIGIKKEWADNKGALQLSITDVLTSVKIHNQYGTLTKEAFAIKNQVYLDLESSRTPIFKLTYTRPIGRNKTIEKTNAAGVTELKERVNQ